MEMNKKELFEFIDSNLDIIGGDKPDIDVNNSITMSNSTTDQTVDAARQTGAQDYYMQMGYTPYLNEKEKAVITESALIEDYISSLCGIEDEMDKNWSNPKLEALSNQFIEFFLNKTSVPDQYILISKILEAFKVNELPDAVKFSLIKKFKSNNPTISEQ